MLDFFAKNAPNPQHWTINSCFGAFLSGWVHLGPFRYCTKLAAKRAKLVQLMQKFVPRCLVRFFHNICPRSTPLDPKLMFWCVSFPLGAFGTVFLLHETRCKMGQLVQLMQKFVPQSLVRISRNLRSRSTQLDPKLMFSCVSFRLCAFGTVSLLHKTRNKTGHTGAINGKVRAKMSCYNFTQRTLPMRTIGP